MEDVMPQDGARLIQDAIANLGWPADVSALVNEVHRLNIGLPCEDEFSTVCAWLGKCQLLHKLDQQQVPVTSRREFQVPDLLAKFSTQCANSPVLIEVKSNKNKVLSFKPDYLQRLNNYAELLGFPLLIAWKFHGLWTLFEVKHLRRATRNLNISLSKAMQENLLGILVGDLAYKIGPGAGVHLRLRKDKLVKQDTTAHGHTQEWVMTIDDVSFTDYEGNIRSDLNAEVTSLFTTWATDEREDHEESHIYMRFVAGDEGLQFAHAALVHLLNWELPHTERPHWRALLRKEPVITNISNFSAALNKALQQKVVSHIFQMQPHSVPDFMKEVVGNSD